MSNDSEDQVTAGQARQAKWWKRSKAERESIYQERGAQIDANLEERLGGWC